MTHEQIVAAIKANLLLADEPAIRHGVYLKRKGKG